MSEKPYTTEERETAQAILRHLIKYPEAKDTVEGIAQWWLEEKKGGRMNVKRAVSLLLSQGVVAETRRKGLRPYYKLRPRQRAAALRLLREL